jgi:site-specific recombinase XerD
MNISAKNSTLKNQMETNFKAYLKNFESLKNLSINTNDEIKTALEKYNSFFSNDTRNILKLAYKTMENSISSNNFSDENISSYKTQITTFQNQNEQVILTVSGNYFLGLK